MASLDDSVIDVDATLNPDKKEEEEEVFGPFSFKNINPRKGKPIIPRPKKDVFRFWPTNADYSFKDDSTLISCYANADDPAFSAVKLNIKNFSPNFYLKLPRGWGAHMCNELLQFLNKKLTYVLKRDLVFQEQKYDRLCDLVKGGKKLIKEEVEKKKKKIEVLTERLNAINDVVNADIKQVGIIVKNRIKSLCTVDKKKDVKRSKTDKANPLGKDKGKEKKAKIEETEEVKKLREFEERAIFLIRKKSEIDITQLKTKISKLENEVTDPGGIVQNKAWIKSQSLRAMIDELKAVTESETPYVTSYEFTEANEFVYWSPEGTKFEFVKFYVSYPKLVKKCRTILENPKHYFKFHEELIPDIEPDDAYKQHFQIFEADVDFILRWLVDTHSTPCTWFKIDPGKYNLTEAKDRSSRCPIEIDVNYEDILKEEAPEYASKTPDLVEFVTDIEVKTNGKRFCRSDTDEICDIVVAVSRMSEQKPVYYSFTLGSTDHDDPDNNVFNYNDEKVMLRDFIKFLRAVDPDVIGHHNGNAFDIPYIVRRCVNLGIKEAIYIGRATRKPIYKHSNTNRGKKKTYVNIPGVTNVDLLRYAEDNYTWDGNTLSEIAYRILDKQTKLEMAYEQIEEHTKTKKGRTRLLKYCKVDVYLTWAILRKLKYYLCIETARLAKIPLDYALNKALGMKVKGRLLQECVQNKPGFICKLKRTTPKITIPGYAGAKVLPPRPGYYLGEIVITLDFASMYPSIIQWRNICYTTLLKESDIIKYGFKEGVDYWRLPDNVDTGKGVETRHNPKNPAFKITKTVVEIDPKTGEKKERIVDQGMLPRMEAELAAERKRVRGKAEALELELEKMKKEGKGDTPIFGTLKVEFEMLNGRQLAIKMWMNAIYGLAGDKTSSYYKVELALTVTQTGQFMILTVKYTVEDNFNHKYGWTFDATIIYGDTDSVFVWLKGFTGTWAEACSIGLFMAKTVTKMNFSGPVKLEFEKLFINLVMPDDGKKMYYGTKVEATYCSGEKQPYIDKKGLAMKKRGPSLYFKETCKIAIEYICEHGDVNTAFEKVQERLMNLAKGNYQIHELIEKRGLSKDPKEYENVKEIPIVKGDETLTDIAKKMVRDEDEKKMRKRKANVMEDYFDDNGTSKGEEDEYDPEFEERVKKITKRIERTLSGKGKGVTDNADDSEDEGNIDEEKDDNVFPGSLNLIEFASKQFPKGSDIFTILEKLGENAYNAERPKSKYQRRGIHPAVVIARKRAKLNPDIPPRAGDIIDYIIVDKPGVTELSEKAEEPLTVIKEGMQPDIQYQLDKMRNALGKIFVQPLKKLDPIKLKMNTPPKKVTGKKKLELDSEAVHITDFFSPKKKQKVNKGKLEEKEEVKQEVNLDEKARVRKRKKDIEAAADIIFFQVDKYMKHKKMKMNGMSTMAKYVTNISDNSCYFGDGRIPSENTIAKGICDICQIEELYESYRDTYEEKYPDKMGKLQSIVTQKYNNLAKKLQDDIENHKLVKMAMKKNVAEKDEYIQSQRVLARDIIKKTTKDEDLILLFNMESKLIKEQKEKVKEAIKAKDDCFGFCTTKCSSYDKDMILKCETYSCANLSKRKTTLDNAENQQRKFKNIFCSHKELEW